MLKNSVRNKILYISTNDGSDMRINKEIKTLSLYADIYFLGVGVLSENSFAKPYCKYFHLIPYKRNSLRAILFHIIKFVQLSFSHRFHSYHIINEQLMMFFYPFLFNKNVVLDIFDSIFMKFNALGNQLRYLKKIVYAPVNHLLVTDVNRKSLMPEFVQDKITVLENFPFLYDGSTTKNTTKITIYYNGSMSKARGTDILFNLITRYPDINLIMAGWLSDKETDLLSKLPNVDYRGVVTQQVSMQIAANEANYIMCCYEPSNQNNINASPNKIYDAIQSKTAVIINREVKVSALVIQKKIGVILESFKQPNYKNLYNDLKKTNYQYTQIDAKEYSWERIENKLLKVHNLI